jgi:hypothetical protein
MDLENDGRAKRQHGGATSSGASTANPVVPGGASPTQIDFDRHRADDGEEGRTIGVWRGGVAAADGSGPSAARREGGGPALLAWCLTAPVALFYLMHLILHWVPVTVTDSENCERTVRLRLAINFSHPWMFLFTIDFFCLCPAHYWLTLYDRTATVDWARNGNARGTVEAVAAELSSLTRAEAIHFTGTIVPLFLGLIVTSVIEKNWVATITMVIGLAVFVGGQRFFGLLAWPRAAIVRVRGPAAPDFAWGAMKGSFVAALCILVWATRCIRWWHDAPILLPVKPPPYDVLPHPKIVEIDYGADVWQGMTCNGTLTHDLAAPWVVNVSSCDDGMFIDRRINATCMSQPACLAACTSLTATLPSQWTAQGFRHFAWGWNAAFISPAAFMFYQVLLGEGMFSSMKQLQYHWTEVLGAFTLIGWLILALLYATMFFSEDSNVEFDWAMADATAPLPPLLLLVSAALTYRDSIAELARSRATRATRWDLGGQYAAFMSHYKNEAAADARQVKDKLVEKLGAPVFLDSDDLMDLRNLCHQVAMSDVLVLFQTRSLLTRPWCLVAIYTALTEGVPIVAVCVAGAFPYNFADAEHFLDNCPRPPGAVRRPSHSLAFSIENRFFMALLYACAGHSIAFFGGFRPG